MISQVFFILYAYYQLPKASVRAKPSVSKCFIYYKQIERPDFLIFSVDINACLTIYPNCF